MPAPTPQRDRRVYVAGAGLSKALGLPNTAELLDGIFDLARRKKRWLISERLPSRIEDAFRYFYPDARHKGYRPDVVDFFSAMRTYVDVGAGFPGGFHDAPELYRSLKFAVAHLLIEKLRECDADLRRGHAYLTEMVQPGHIVITSNWDLVIERYAQLHGVPLRFAGHDPGALVLLKLHGSVDWCAGAAKISKYLDADYALLVERLFGSTTYRPSLPARPELDGTSYEFVHSSIGVMLGGRSRVALATYIW